MAILDQWYPTKHGYGNTARTDLRVWRRLGANPGCWIRSAALSDGLHYNIGTGQAYVDWIRRFILVHGERRPAEIGAVEVEAFLTQLAVQGQVASSTHNQALNAIVLLYRPS